MIGCDKRSRRVRGMWMRERGVGMREMVKGADMTRRRGGGERL